MGTFTGYYGDMTIPEEKREEFTQRALTVLTHGGMMGDEEVNLFGDSLLLLSPPPECTLSAAWPSWVTPSSAPSLAFKSEIARVCMRILLY